MWKLEHHGLNGVASATLCECVGGVYFSNVSLDLSLAGAWCFCYHFQPNYYRKNLFPPRDRFWLSGLDGMSSKLMFHSLTFNEIRFCGVVEHLLMLIEIHICYDATSHKAKVVKSPKSSLLTVIRIKAETKRRLIFTLIKIEFAFPFTLDCLHGNI